MVYWSLHLLSASIRHCLGTWPHVIRWNVIRNWARTRWNSHSALFNGKNEIIEIEMNLLDYGCAIKNNYFLMNVIQWQSEWTWIDKLNSAIWLSARRYLCCHSAIVVVLTRYSKNGFEFETETIGGAHEFDMLNSSGCRPLICSTNTTYATTPHKQNTILTFVHTEYST